MGPYAIHILVFRYAASRPERKLCWLQSETSGQFQQNHRFHEEEPNAGLDSDQC